MKRIIKILSVIMATIMFFSVFSAANPAIAAQIQKTEMTEESVTDVVAVETEESDESEAEAVIVGEDETRRDEYTKHFIMSDGSRRAVRYSQAVHYRENGKWTDIDNTLEYDNKNDEYTNKSNYFDVKFKENFNDDDFFSIENEGYSLSWEYVDNGLNKYFVDGEVEEIPKPQGNDEKFTRKHNGNIRYNNFEKNCELEYVVTGNGVKENIILNKKTDKNEFSFNVTAEGLTLVKNTDGSISANSTDGEEIFYIPAPFMFDAEGIYSYDVEYKIEDLGNGKYTLSVVADKDWLTSDDRAYPITIDPAIQTNRTKAAIETTFVSSGNPSKNYNDMQDVYIGVESSDYLVCRALFEFELPELQKGDMVIGGYLCLVQHSSSFYTSTMPDQEIDAHLVTGTWNASTVTWNTKPSYDSIALDYSFLKNNVNEWKNFDITKAVKGWYEGTYTNNGIMIKKTVETGSNADVAARGIFWSDKYNGQEDYYPYIEIIYRNNKGLEDYWSYSSYGVGTAGTAYINDYTGNLVYSLPILSSSGELMPLALSATYNNYCANERLTVGKNNSSRTTPGKGFRLSIQETVLPSEKYGLTGENKENYPYVYTDGDGTEHYIQKVKEKDKDGKETTVYKDEDGLNLTLKLDGECSYILTDKAGTERWFNSKGNLLKILDANGNEIHIYFKPASTADNLEEKSRISYITDGSGHKFTFTYYEDKGVELDYIKTIKDNAGRTIYFTTTGGFLRSVKYYDETVTKIVYEGENSSTPEYEESAEGLINYVLSNDGYGLNFDYTSKATGRRVKKVKEFGTSANGTFKSGQIVTFDRTEYNTTVVRSAGIDGFHYESDNTKGDDDIITTLQFDNSGRTVAQQIKYGNGSMVGAGSYGFTDSSGEAASLGSKNRVSSTGSMGKSVVNLLTGGNAESTTGWTHSASSPAVATEKYMGTKSLKLSVSGLTGSGNTYYRQKVEGLTKGGKYTLSAYVKVGNVTATAENKYTGAHLQITTVGTDGATDEPVRSEAISETTDTGIDNGWRRITATVTIPQDTASTYVYLCLRNMNGTAYFDCIQLESGSVANSFNILENSSFEKSSNGLPSGWSAINTSYSTSSTGTVTNGITTVAKANGTKSVRITGEPDVAKGYSQKIYVDGKAEETYIVSGWGRGYPVNSTFHTTGTEEAAENIALFEIAVKVTYDRTDKDKNVTEVSQYKDSACFNTTITSWQYASTPFSLEYSKPDEGCTYTPKYFQIVPRYSRQVNYVYFDHLMLVKEPSQTYTYDKEGNLLKATANSEQKANAEYDENDNMTSYTDTLGNTTKMNYDSKHNMINSSSPRGIKTENTYNSKGFVTSTEVHNKSLSTDKDADGYVAPTMNLRTSRAFYDEVESTLVKESTFVRAEYDENGYGTYYTYDYDTGVTETVKNAKGITTTYGYDSNDVNLTSVTSGYGNVSYTYDGKQLSKIVFGSEGYDEEYSFGYDEYGNKTNTYIGDAGNLQLLVENEYGTNNGTLDLTTYGNGDTIRYEYTNLGQKNRVFYNGSEDAAYYWRYDASGTPVLHQDNQNDRRYYYGYDSLGRLCRMEIRADNSDEFLGYVEQGYDLHNNVNKLVTNLGGRTNTQQYFYVENDKNSNSASYSKDALPSAYVFTGNRYATYEYDSLDRLTERRFSTETALYNNYTYKLSANRNTGDSQLYRTQQLSTEYIGNDAYTYYYDVLGNITSVKKGERKSTEPTSADFKTVTNAGDYRSYTYDNLSQLTREDNKTTGLTNLWTYDRLGNIQTKTEYNYTEDTSITANRNLYVDYQYGTDNNTSFNKLLKNIDVYSGTSDEKSTRYAITYDEIGNPTKYEKISYDDKGVQVGDTVTAASLTWRGRQLMKLTDSVNSNTISYLYDADGLRGSKTVNGAKTTYTYVGDKLCYQHTANADGTTNYELYFFYDSKGALSVLQYYIHSGTTVNGYTYYVASNAFGDVTGLYGADGVLRVAYEYDAWGNVISVTDADENKITNPNSIAHRNPIRYRGYYYDVETGFYYLQSRYYCPKIGRFINADSELSDIGGDVLGNNSFSYCQSNPVNMSDPTGHWPSWATKVLIGTAVIAAIAVVTVATYGSGTALACLAVGALKGALVGAAIGAASGAATGAVGHRLSTGSWDGAGQAALEGAADGYMSGAISGAISGAATSGACFIAGTAVLSALGSKAIEDINAGEFVWSENPETGEKALKQVVRTFVNESDILIHVFVNGEEIITTPEHPFYVPQKGWVGSIHLRAGDILVLQNGEYVIVEKIQHEILEKPITVYNFEVEDFHTYYVGENSVLVHNLCTQKHHLLTNKHKTYTPKFQQITDKYNLNLNAQWNIREVANHSGRHATAYHEFMYGKLVSLDAKANGNIDVFMKGFNELADYVVNNTSIMY